MVEQAIYFAIGFLIASLSAIIALPTISRRATRLADARARLQAPSTEKQALADADALRARHAVHEAQLAQKLGLAESAANALRVDVGRLSAQIIALKSEASEREGVLFDKQSAIEKLEWHAKNLRAGLAAAQIAIHDVMAQRDQARDSESAALARRQQLEAAANHDRAQIATLMATAENLEARLQETVRAAAATAAESEATHHKLATSLAEQAALALRHEDRLQDVTREHERLREAATREKAVLESVRRHIPELEIALAASERAREETLLENGRQLQRLGERETALQLAEARIRDLEAQLPRSGSDAALRASIRQLGREVSRLYAARTMEERAEREPGELPGADPERAPVKGQRRRPARSDAPES